MKVAIPKALKGSTFDRLMGVEFNDFDVERLLPSLFYITVTRGRQVARRLNSETDLDKYVAKLAAHDRMQGFAHSEGQRLLERWLRGAIVQMGRAGRSRRAEQIEYVQPLTLLTYKTGFPAKISRQRRVHQFLYSLFVRTLAHRDVVSHPESALAGLFATAFGRGVVIGDAPKYNGHFSGDQQVDIHTLLCLNFLDGLEACPASTKEAVQPDPSLPRTATRFAEDVLSFVVVCRDEMPLLSLTRSLMALINCWLFVYTLKMMYATNQLVANGALPVAMIDSDGTTPPEIYADLTGERGGESDKLANACVEMHLEEIRAFYHSMITLRTLDRFLDALPPQVASARTLKSMPTPRYLEALADLRGDIHVEARAASDVQAIRRDTVAMAASPEEAEELEAEFDQMLSAAGEGGMLALLVRLLTEAQASDGVQKLTAWYWNTGGLGKPYGLLSGNLRGNRRWRYLMSDDLLAVLVRLSLITVPEEGLHGAHSRRRISLGSFLEFLETRFGIIIDRPPSELDSAATRAAAKENVEALKRRLRLMGLFEALSDDFNAQFIEIPMTEAVSA